jgi:hypothetical protein
MPMPIDSLDLAGDASAILERHGLVACGRRTNGKTRVDFWTRDGMGYRHELSGTEVSVDEIVAACLAQLPPSEAVKPARRTSDLS